MEHGPFEFLPQEECFQINRKLIIALGMDSALFLTELINKKKELNKTKKNKEEDWLPCSAREITNLTYLTRNHQEKVKEKLKRLNFISVIKKGNPPTLNFKINKDKIKQLLIEETSSLIKYRKENIDAYFKEKN